MTTFADSMDDKRAAVLETIARIEGGATVDLARLRTDLVALSGMIRRNPGIEAAAADLYVAATALVKYSTLGLHPLARHQRLFREAHQRFRDRLVSARPSADPNLEEDDATLPAEPAHFVTI